jgi:N-acetylmuramoyl-L-alanine amidase
MTNLSALRYPKADFLGGAYYDSGTFAKGQPVAILQHYTAGGPSIERLHGKNESSVSVQFVVDRDGTVTQTGLVSQCCHHAGASSWRGLTGFNKLAIGIEQANYGYWRPGIKPATRDAAIKAGWLEAVHQSGKGAKMLWEPYPEKQILANLDLCRWLLANVPTIKYMLGHDDIALFRGKVDPGPAFPMERFKALILGDDQNEPSRYEVVSTDNLNVRALPAGTAEKLPWANDGLAPGTVVELLKTDGEWSFVRLDKNQGWVYSEYIRRI